MNIKILFILTAIPLIIYPGVLMAGVMSLTAPVRSDTPLLILIVARTFLISSLFYPVGWLVGVFLPHHIGVFVPVIHLAICLFSFAAWYSLSS